MTTPPLVEFRGVSLAFGANPLFTSVDLAVEAGSSVAIVGHEGSGKTALLKLCLGMVFPTEGTVLVDGRDTRSFSPHDLRALRARMGFVQQAGGLLSNLTLIENLLLPLRYHNLCDEERQSRIHMLAMELDLGHHLGKLPGELPEMVQKRGRLARALALAPRVILADHPLAGVTEGVADSIVECLDSARTSTGAAVLSTSHTVQGARRLAQKVYHIDNKRIRPL